MVKTDQLKTGIELRDKHLKEKLESSKFPEITMVKAKGSGSKGKGTCILKIKGLEKKVPFTFKENKDKVTFEMEVSLKDFKFKKISYLGVSVVDKVKITGDLPLKK